MNSKFLTPILFLIIFLGLGLTIADAKSLGTISQQRYDKICKWGIFNPPECKKRIVQTKSRNSKDIKGNSEQVISSQQNTQKEGYDGGCGWGIFNPPKCRDKYKDYYKKGDSANKSHKQEKKIKTFEEENHNVSFYTGTFDVIDKEGDDKTNLIGIEHKNKDLFRNTWIGRFSPTSGAFVTGKSSVYLYTGIEADYNLGPINISPSFAPGYYEAGDGKNLGSAFEFKSEVKIGVDLFKNTNLGYSFSHISNNDWGDTNPGTDNQSLTFSKKF